jgi:hypothetical protein
MVNAMLAMSESLVVVLKPNNLLPIGPVLFLILDVRSHLLVAAPSQLGQDWSCLFQRVCGEYCPPLNIHLANLFTRPAVSRAFVNPRITKSL